MTHISRSYNAIYARRILPNALAMDWNAEEAVQNPFLVRSSEQIERHSHLQLRPELKTFRSTEAED